MVCIFSNSVNAVRHTLDSYKNQPGRIEDYEPGHSSLTQKEIEQVRNGNSLDPFTLYKRIEILELNRITKSKDSCILKFILR